MTPTIHILKTLAEPWEAIKRGDKTFEVRLNDRFFQRGDVVILRRMSNSGRSYAMERDKPMDLSFKIGWTLQGGRFGIEPGYVVFQLEPLDTP